MKRYHIPGTSYLLLDSESGELVMYDDVADMERRLREAMVIIRMYAIEARDVSNSLIEDADAFLAAEQAIAQGTAEGNA